MEQDNSPLVTRRRGKRLLEALLRVVTQRRERVGEPVASPRTTTGRRPPMDGDHRVMRLNTLCRTGGALSDTSDGGPLFCVASRMDFAIADLPDGIAELLVMKNLARRDQARLRLMDQG